jgi:hypothetical protein
MSESLSSRAGAYAADISVAYPRAGFLGGLVAAGWVAFPFAVATVLHPEDAVRAQLKLQGEYAHGVLTAQQIGFGLVEALFVLAVLAGCQLVATTLFYRRVRLDGEAVAAPPLWPLAGLLSGVIGNAAWFIGTGFHLDAAGLVIGLTPVALTVGAEMICEQLGRDFVFGPATGAHPAIQTW